MNGKFVALHIEHREGIPDYLLLKQRLSSAIMAGFWRPEEVLPSVELLADYSGVDIDQARLALVSLTRDGQVANQDGAYRITPKIDQPLDKLTNLSTMLRQRGFEAGSRWLARRMATPNDEEILWLDVPVTKQVAKLDRLRLAGTAVVALEMTSLPDSIVPDPQLVDDSLYEYLRTKDIAVATATQHIEAMVVSDMMSKITGFTPGSPILHLTRVGYELRGQPIELTHSYFRSDYYRLVVELKR
ncbi:GntR family transcriptional regulator [Andreprevotia lacus DSM 23236]|uniref:GntR family transcriptional regulator n=1 Tax=Andreprevotia lacus DSM 23236 TaxID=1121001 RepID=A0A1W1XG49_9NEIS|nr:GntR family transcriptional regulator [Andreprevotia lacus]SMC22772.1 GntR family transcriptional regulator [Andreprevotia lacus DSM 23236]